MNLALCEYAEKRNFTAGNKARTDVVRILVNNGYRHVPLFRSKNNKLVILYQMIVGCIRTFFLAGEGNIVLIQYPYNPAIVNNVLIKVLCIGRVFKKFRIAILVHDSRGLRNIYNDDGISTDKMLKAEVKLLDNSDFVICHNSRMIEEFRRCGGKGTYKELGPFDYLYDGELAIQPSFNSKKTIIVAGNLSKEKCGYLYHITDAIKDAKFNFYGLGYNKGDCDRVSYKGTFPPEELINHLKGHFGLVWDGESCETCSGVYGQYLRYNNPHKFSLYLAAGIPVIVWAESALADYVKRNNVGICVNSLFDIDCILRNITDVEYKTMQNNVNKIRKELVVGEHLKKLCVI